MTLSPTLAAEMAEGVYGIRTQTNIADGLARGGLSNDEFEVGSSARRVEGVSGGRLLSKKSGFGVVLHGKSTARRSEVAIICRGTDIGYDWLSNLSASAEAGPGGLPVHAGFNRVFKSISSGFEDALRGRDPSVIHVVGHSLGGALANLVAAQLAGRANVKLYTFGAPRPGFGMFSDDLGRKLGVENIKRVYAKADPVPMLSLFPFRHAPRNPDGIRIDRGGQAISVSSHLMENYGPAVKDADWRGLAMMSSEAPTTRSVDEWLSVASRAAIMPGSTVALYALNKALDGILSLAEKFFGLALFGFMTVMDKLAYMLEQSVRVSQEMGYLLKTFVETVMRFLGRATATVSEITRAFLRYVLELLFRAIAATARQALSRLV